MLVVCPLLLVFLSSAGVAEAVLEDKAEDLDVEPEVLLAAVIAGVLLILCLCACFLYCCFCKAKGDPIPPSGDSFHDGTDVNSNSATFAVSSSPKNVNIRQVSAGDLPNDVSENDRKKEKQLLKPTNVVLPNPNGPIGGTSKNRTSVKDIAALGFINPVRPLYKNDQGEEGKKLYDDEETEEGAASPKTPQSKQDLLKKVERIAHGAAAGVYNTGSSTARLSMDIVKGFDLMREKKKMEAEKAKLEELEDMAESGESPTGPEPVQPPSYTKVPEGKQRLDEFLGHDD